MLTSREIDGLEINAGYLTDQQRKSDDSHNSGLKSLTFGGASYQFNDQLSGALYASHVEDVLNKQYLGLNYKCCVASPDRPSAVLGSRQGRYRPARWLPPRWHLPGIAAPPRGRCLPRKFALRDRLLTGAFQHQIRRPTALQRIGKRRHRLTKLQADRCVMRFARHDPLHPHPSWASIQAAAR